MKIVKLFIVLNNIYYYMKLLNTIHKLINEAEDNLYNASLGNDNLEEIQELESKLEDSFKLLSIYKDLF
jgi:hypothetical protein